MDLALHETVHRIDHDLFNGLTLYDLPIRSEDNRGVIVLVGDLDDVVLREVGIAETTLGA